MMYHYRKDLIVFHSGFYLYYILYLCCTSVSQINVLEKTQCVYMKHLQNQNRLSVWFCVTFYLIVFLLTIFLWSSTGDFSVFFNRDLQCGGSICLIFQKLMSECISPSYFIRFCIRLLYIGLSKFTCHLLILEPIVEGIWIICSSKQAL